MSFYGTDYDEKGRPVDPGAPPDDAAVYRAVRLIPASRYPVRRARWLHDGRIACGTVSLLAGREGLGKSTVAYWMASRITRGELPGEYQGEPRPVFVCATEDSWSHTIVPRLIAAGADLDLVFNVEVETIQGTGEPLSLPVDIPGVADAAREAGAVLMLLDPLMSRLSARLDTHRDQEVRQALEPLARMADVTGMAVLGLIHLNKSGRADPLDAVMGSKAFTAVARSVSLVVPDPDDPDERRRLFGTPKNNLGPDDLPMISFTLASAVIESDDGDVRTSRVLWGDEVELSTREVMSRAGQDSDSRSAADEAGAWLEDWLATQGGEAPSKDAKQAGTKAGHTEAALRRGQQDRRRRIGSRREGMPSYSVWFLKNPAGGSGE